MSVFALVLAASLSVFDCHVSEMIKQRNVTLDEAATALREWGISGIDVMGEGQMELVEQLLARGFKPSAYILQADFAHSDSADAVERALAFARRHRCPRIMLVPGFFRPEEKREDAWRALVPRLRDLLARAASSPDMPIEVAVEDFDNDRIILGSQLHLRQAFAEFPTLKFVLDTGNFAHWDEELLPAGKEFQSRTIHVHVKDLSRDGTMKPVSIGSGRMPIREALVSLSESGYRQWYTIECFGAVDMWETVRESAAYLRSILPAESDHPEEVIKLAPIMPTAGKDVMQALRDRKSDRAFSDKALSPEDLSGLLWAANGFNRPDKHTNATGMNKQEIVIYACLPKGAYRYDSKKHELVLVSATDLRPLLATRQDYVRNAPVVLLITAEVDDPIYRNPQWSTMSHYDAGLVGGNIYTYCSARNLATVCRGLMDREGLKRELHLLDQTLLHLNFPVGYRP